jgi:hypothetical protein
MGIDYSPERLQSLGKAWYESLDEDSANDLDKVLTESTYSLLVSSVHYSRVEEAKEEAIKRGYSFVSCVQSIQDLKRDSCCGYSESVTLIFKRI